MSGNASSIRAAAVAAAVALAWLGTLAHAQPDERGRGGGRGDERRWVQQAEPRGGRGGDRAWAQQGDPRGGGGWEHRPGQRQLERPRPDGWRGPPPQPSQPGGWPPAPQGRPDRGGPPPVYAPPPQQVRPPPQWQGRGGERPWNPQAPRLRPGDPLPPEYRQRQYLVNDWRAHRLYAPPPGYQWVQPEPGNYLLIGRNGEIVNMLVGQ